MKKLFLAVFFVMTSMMVRAQSGGNSNYYICKSGPDFMLEMPNIFTPNGDYINDHFLPKVANEICLDEFYMAIYNRWGQLLYESSVYSVGWHGNTFYGDPYPPGTYYYRMNYTVNDARTDSKTSFSQNGFFQLVR